MPGDSIGELDSDMRDHARLFEVSDRPQGVASVERLIAAIELVGGDGHAYRREHAKAARAIIAEVYSPPRVTAAARRLPKYGLQPGLPGASMSYFVKTQTCLTFEDIVLFASVLKHTILSCVVS